MKKLFLPLLLILTFHSAIAQFSWNAELNLQGMASTKKEELPFWMYHNQRGRTEKETNLASWVSGKTFYDLGKAGVLQVGAGFLVRDAHSDKLFNDELYLNYTKNWFELTLGRKQRKEVYNGLSASNESILWSLNTRPLPGLQLKTTRPVFITKNFGFEAALEEYFMDDDRYVNNARVHHKSFHLVYSNYNKYFQIKAGIQHFAQWGGTSITAGKLPSGFDDYLRIFVGRSGSTDATPGDQKNVLGNHIGGYELYIGKSFATFELQLFYNHLFEDGSGSRLGNTPDGRYGIFMNLFNKENWINSAIYEFYYTKHQSSTTSGIDIWDNYFNNSVYRSGWNYFNKTIGAPYFIPNFYDGNWTSGFVRTGNNKFVVHHIGVAGTAFNHLPFKILASFRQNYGHSNHKGTLNYTSDDTRGRLKTPKEVLSIHTDMRLFDSIIKFNLQLGADIWSGKMIGGAGVHMVYKIH